MHADIYLQQIKLGITSLVDQLPGYILAKDINSKFMLASKKAAQLFGFANIDNMIGLNDYDLKCEASQWASEFQDQDKLVIGGGADKTIDFLGYYS